MRIAIVYPDDFSVWHFHRELLMELRRRGHEVLVISGGGEYVDRLESLRVTHIPVEFSRFISPVRDVKLLVGLYRIYRKYRPDVVHNFTIKPNIYSSVAARLAGVGKVVGTAEGLGFLFAERPGWKLRLARPFAGLMYRLGCAACDRFWFVNPDDRDLFLERRMLAERKSFLTISAGVDTHFYGPEQATSSQAEALRKELMLAETNCVALMVVARLVWSKGVREFAEAAVSCREKHPSLRFLLVGPLDDDSPDAVPREYLEKHVSSGTLTWLGFRRDLRSLYGLADFVVLPSYYREGVPNVLLEAMAMGKPVITTDNVGCREVVNDGENGYIVPLRSPEALVSAISRLIQHPNRLKAFADASRRRAVKDFEKTAIVKSVVDSLYAATEAHTS